MLSNVYSKSFLQASSQIEANSRSLLRDRFLPVIEQAARTGTALDVHGMNNGFTMDFMSAYLFGSANATNFTQDAVAKHGFLELYHNRRVYEFFSQEANGLKELTRKIGLPVPVPKWVDEANQRIEAWILKMCDKADLCLDTLPSPGFEPVVYKQLKNSMEKVQGEIWGAEKRDSMRLEMASEMLDELGAGHETSAVALTYLYWEMSQRPDLQRKLRAELITLEPPINWPPGVEGMCQLPAPKSIDGLPLLHAIIMETLRLHSPIPGIQPRITPPGGCTLAGYSNIPANVRVSATAYCLHRNENVFPQPEQWKPERWLKPADSAEMKEMLRWFWAFGSGGRMCLGSNLAMQGAVNPSIALRGSLWS